MRRNPPLIGCRCMAWWRRGGRGNRDSAGLILSGEQCRRGKYHGRLSRSCCGCGCWRRAGSGGLSHPGSAVTLEVPRPGHQCLWGAYSVDIPENAPGRRGADAGSPGTARRMTQQSPQPQGHLVAGRATAPARAAVRGAGAAVRGAGAAVRGAGAAVRGAGAAVRGAGAAVRGAGAGRSGAAAQPGSAAIRVTGPGAGWTKYGGLSPGPRDLPFPVPAFPGACLPRRLPFPVPAFPGACLPRRLPSPG